MNLKSLIHLLLILSSVFSQAEDFEVSNDPSTDRSWLEASLVQTPGKAMQIDLGERAFSLQYAVSSQHKFNFPLKVTLHCPNKEVQSRCNVVTGLRLVKPAFVWTKHPDKRRIGATALAPIASDADNEAKYGKTLSYLDIGPDYNIPGLELESATFTCEMTGFFVPAMQRDKTVELYQTLEQQTSTNPFTGLAEPRFQFPKLGNAKLKLVNPQTLIIDGTFLPELNGTSFLRRDDGATCEMHSEYADINALIGTYGTLYQKIGGGPYKKVPITSPTHPLAKVLIVKALEIEDSGLVSLNSAEVLKSQVAANVAPGLGLAILFDIVELQSALISDQPPEIKIREKLKFND